MVSIAAFRAKLCTRRFMCPEICVPGDSYAGGGGVHTKNKKCSRKFPNFQGLYYSWWATLLHHSRFFRCPDNRTAGCRTRPRKFDFCFYTGYGVIPTALGCGLSCRELKGLSSELSLVSYVPFIAKLFEVKPVFRPFWPLYFWPHIPDLPGCRQLCGLRHLEARAWSYNF
jgi:hypothetical protein